MIYKYKCIDGKMIKVTSQQTLVTKSVCLQLLISGHRHDSFLWHMVTRRDHMLNLTIDKGHVQHSIDCNGEFIHIYYRNLSNKYSGRILYVTLYTIHNEAYVHVVAPFSRTWFLQMKYQVHVKDYAQTNAVYLRNADTRIDIPYSPSMAIRERLQIFLLWYYNLPISFLADPFGIAKRQANLTITEFRCGGDAWLSLERGLQPLVWMRVSHVALRCCTLFLTYIVYINISHSSCSCSERA